MQCPNVQIKSLREPPSQFSFSTGSWPWCIVPSHDQMIVENNGHCSRVYMYRCSAVRWSNRDLLTTAYQNRSVSCWPGRPGACSEVRSIALSWAVDRDLPRLARSFTVSLSFIAEFYEECEDCEPEGSFFSQISPHLKPDTIRKIHTPTVEFSVIGSDFKASMLVKCACTCFSERA